MLSGRGGGQSLDHGDDLLRQIARGPRREIKTGDADEALGEHVAIRVAHYEVVPNAARIFERARDADVNQITGLDGRAVFRRHVDSRHAELQVVEQRLTGPPENGREEFLLGILEPAEVVGEPRDARSIAVRPMNLLLDPEQLIAHALFSADSGA
jgi:hypothetical protein